MNLRIFYLLLILITIQSCTSTSEKTEFIAGDMVMVMDENARISRFYGRNDGGEYLMDDSASYLIQMRFEETIIPPESMKYDKTENMLYFYFPGDREVKVKIVEMEDYLRFELFNIRSVHKPDLLIWGPFYSNIR